MEVDAQAFEFERKFFVRELPELVADAHHTLIIQGYVFAEEGYAVRLRVNVPDYQATFDGFDPATDKHGAYERRVLAGVSDKIMNAWITVKSPPVMAERYEFDHVIDTTVALNILQRCSTIVIKNRHSIWLGEDGWEIDEFGGQNTGLVIAECERTGPVTNLTIPSFAATEVSSDGRFTNDYLSKEPWVAWKDSYLAELDAKGPFFENL